MGNDQLHPGDLITDRYRVIERLGEGGIGSVYRVEQIFLNKEFALKILHKAAYSETALLRFHQEAQAAGKLNHRNLIQAIDFGLLNDRQPFLVMELAKGKTLSWILEKQSRLPADLVLEIFIPLLEGLAYAHTEGIIHRDLKPGNIIIEPDPEQDGRYIPKVIDFGLAKIITQNEGASLTVHGAVIGTPLYMSPEQCKSEPTDAKSDVYSLGCVMFHCLTGRPPFFGESFFETVELHLSAQAPALSEAAGDLDFPESLQDVMDLMMAKDPADRLPDCVSVKERLMEVLNDIAAKEEEEVARSIAQLVQEEPGEKKPASPKKKYAIAAIALLAGIVLAVSVSTAIQFEKQKPLTLTDSRIAPDRLLSERKQEEPLTPPYSKGGSAERVFEFPYGLEVGDFFWDAGNTIAHRTGKGRIEVPRNREISLGVAKRLLMEPDKAAGFRTGDYEGLVAKSVIGMDDSTVDQAFQKLLSVRSLKYICLREVNFEPLTMEKLGALPDLKMLSLDKCDVDLETLSALKNFNNLRFFYYREFMTPYPVLERFTRDDVPLKCLGLNDCPITAVDLSMITQMKALRALHLANNQWQAADKIELFRELSKIKTLDNLAIDYDMLAGKEEQLSLIKGIKQLYVSNCPEPEGESLRLKRMHPRLQTVIEESDHPAELAQVTWFNPVHISLFD